MQPCSDDCETLLRMGALGGDLIQEGDEAEGERLEGTVGEENWRLMLHSLLLSYRDGLTCASPCGGQHGAVITEKPPGLDGASRGARRLDTLSQTAAASRTAKPRAQRPRAGYQWVSACFGSGQETSSASPNSPSSPAEWKASVRPSLSYWISLPQASFKSSGSQ